MFTPKINFSLISLKLEINLVYFFLFEDKWGWNKKVVNEHPQFKKALNLRSKKSREEYIKGYIIRLRTKRQPFLKKQMENYSRNWRKIEKECFIILPEILETSWPKNRKIIKAMLSMNPICPRFINDWSFSLFYKQNPGHMKETILHEVCHFLYFKKWKEVFPKTKRETFEFPYLEWHLSEILAPVILNDPRIQKLLRKEPAFYDEYKKLKINELDVPRYFTNLYKQYVHNKDGHFNAFLKEAYSVIRQNRNIFKTL